MISIPIIIINRKMALHRPAIARNKLQSFNLLATYLYMFIWTAMGNGRRQIISPMPAFASE